MMSAKDERENIEVKRLTRRIKKWELSSKFECLLMFRGRIRLLLFMPLVLPGFPGLNGLAATNDIQFNRDIRPILSESCFSCHGPDKNVRKAKLRLDVREVAIEREAIVPGKPDESKVVEHIFATDPDEIMPPPKSRKNLTEAQKELLKKWIAAGAEYQPHWAYIQPQRPEVPQTRNPQWVRNPIDAFILHSLENKKIRPSREADKAELLRRLSLDLIGLPPTVEEASAYLADKSPKAYERQVDRLLASPHFGERMAVPWLDLVRYADTVGYHGDQNVNVFPYRDYVIDAFNRNKPFDQFTIEQIAGDLLPHPSKETLVATAFNRLNMMTREGGAQPKEYLAKYAGDRVRTLSMAWLGSTMGCAECHDHKFDPFSTKDFYQMEAFFADVKQWGVYQDYGYTPNPELKGFSNDHPFPPEIEVASPYLERRIAGLERRSDDLSAQIASRRKADRLKQAAFEQWRKSSLAFLKQWPTGWVIPSPGVALQMKDTNSIAQTNFTVRADASVAFSDQPKENLKLTLGLSNTWVSAIRLEIVPQEGAVDKTGRRKKRSGASIALAASIKSADANKASKLSFYDAEADHKQERYVNGFAVIGVKDMWQISPDHEQQVAVWILDKPVEVKNGDALVVDFGNLAVASARVAISPFVAGNPLKAGIGEPLRKALEKSRSSKSVESLVARTYLLSTASDREGLQEIRKVQKDIRQCRNGLAQVVVTEAREPLVTRVLGRGNWQDETGEIVSPGVPHFLPQIPNPEGRRLTRLDLARWLVSRDNPLTARAVVNRLWEQFFGTGISAVVDDLGGQGEWPVHPFLLDWLACEFMQPAPTKAASAKSPPAHAWDIKHMVKLMVMSSTYRQDSNERPDLKEIDPLNRLVAFQTPRRLEAEFVRDNALFIAGLLNEDLGGPPVHPYQPAGYYANLQFPDRDYYPELDERQYRRGVYTHWQRTFLQPMLANFDAPSREECTAIRTVSNTPQQALTLLNDPTFVEASRVLAAQLFVREGQTDEQMLDLAFERALARVAKNNERASLLRFLAAQREHYRENPEETKKLMTVGIAPTPKNAAPGELAAWTQVCRVILNLHETITIY
jgi:hypothetical protein